MQTIYKTHILQHPIGYCHICKLQTKKIVTHPPDFELTHKATVLPIQRSKPQTKAIAAHHCPTPPASAQHHRGVIFSGDGVIFPALG
jgi:hypothetical protein